MSSLCITGMSTPPPDRDMLSEDMAINIGVPLAGFFLLLAVVVGIFKIWRNKSKGLSMNKNVNIDSTTLAAVPVGDDSLKGEFLEI